MVKNKICILAFIGSDNTGDEAILFSLLSAIRNTENLIRIFSFNTEKTKALLKDLADGNIEVINIENHSLVLRKIIDSDILICGGGGIIQDRTSFYSLPFFLLRALLAKSANKKIMFYGIGAEPLRSNFSKILTKFVLNSSNIITVRDKESKQNLLDCGIKNNLIKITADPAVSLGGISGIEAKKLLREQGININKKIMVICLRQWFDIYRLIPVKIVKKFNIRTKKDKLKYEYFIKEISKFLEYCENKLEFQLVFLPFWKERDNKVHKEVRELIKNKDNVFVLEKHYNPLEIKGIISIADFILGMRLHSIIFATTKKKDFLAINYSEKVKNYLNILITEKPTLENVYIDPENFSQAELIKKMDFFLSNKPSWSPSFAKKISGIINQEKKNIYYFKEVLNTKPKRKKFH